MFFYKKQNDIRFLVKYLLIPKSSFVDDDDDDPHENLTRANEK